MKRFLIYNRIFLLVVAILIQLVVLVEVILRFNQYFEVFYAVNITISALAFVWVVNSQSAPAYKMAWIVLILLFPIFGGLFYIFFGGSTTGRRTKEKLSPILQYTEAALSPVSGCLDLILGQDVDAGNQSLYIQNSSLYPPYRNTRVEFLPSGEAKFARLMEELQKAEHYIFLEYFIIKEGFMWKSILKILKEKAAAGVDVRVIYDDFGCLAALPYQYDRVLESMGIKCGVFHPVLPHPLRPAEQPGSPQDRGNRRAHGIHRGINLADEYINKIEMHGHWKDAAIMIKGEAVWSLTVMFLSMWNYIKGIRGMPDISQFHPDTISTATDDGFVQPFSDSPLDDEPVSELVYLNLINKATDYVYITTPYLILSHEMVTALCLAAKSGVDVRIITPTIQTNGTYMRCRGPITVRWWRAGSRSMNTCRDSFIPRPWWWMANTVWWALSIWTTAAFTCILSAGYGSIAIAVSRI